METTGHEKEGPGPLLLWLSEGGGAPRSWKLSSPGSPECSNFKRALLDALQTQMNVVCPRNGRSPSRQLGRRINLRRVLISMLNQS